jgi:RHS repeat-associated protein
MPQFFISLFFHFFCRYIFRFLAVRVILQRRAAFFTTLFNCMKPAVLLSAIFLWGAGVQASSLTVTTSGANVQVQWQRNTSGPVVAYEANVFGPGVSSTAQAGNVTAAVGSGTHTYRFVERISYSGSSVPQQNTLERTVTITDQGLAPTSVSVNPTGLSCTQDQLTLSWPAVASSRYAVEARNRVPGGTWPSAWSLLTKDLSSLSFVVSPLTEGREYEFRVSAASTSPGGAYSVWRNSAVVRKESCAASAASETPFNATPSLVTDAEIAETDSVGVISGQFRVNEGGAATYTIPVTVAPGTAGVTPQLALAYSSHTGNGLLGKGWSLEGLGAISRCRQTLMQDRKALPISWNQDDRFCLNGARLLLVSGEYGEPESEYKTEVDSFVKVTAKGGTAGKPDYFLMEARDGSVTRFGGAGDDSSETKVYDSDGDVQTDKVLNWNISQFEDSVGNAIKFFYSASRNYHRVAQIDYAFGAATTAGASVVFEYEDRRDPTHSFIAGYRLSNTVRLKRIIAKDGSKEIRRYVLNYANVSSSVAASTLSRVMSVEECVGEINCLPKTSFTWSGYGANGSRNAAATDFHADVVNRPLLSPEFADIDGDGFLEPVWINTGAVQYYLDGVVHSTSYAHIQDEQAQVRVLDYNLDGRDDILVYDAIADEKWRLLLSTPQASIGSNGKVQWRLQRQDIKMPFSEKEVQFIDFNSDGILDAVQLDRKAKTLRIFKGERSGKPVTSAQYYRFNSTPLDVPIPGVGHLTEESIVWGDFNGDGRTDVAVKSLDTPNPHNLWIIDHRLDVFISNSQGAIEYAHTLSSGGGYIKMLRAVDINGDGLTDIAYLMHEGTWKYLLSTGSGFEGAKPVGSTGETLNDEYANFIDLNSDGYPDFYWRSGSTIRYKVWLPDTQGFSSTATFRSSMPWGDHGIGYSLKDLDNNGALDLVGIAAGANFSDGSRGIRVEHSAGNATQFVGTIRNGLGAEIKITYSPLNGLVDKHLYGTYEGFDISSSTREVCKGGYSIIPSSPGFVPRTCREETVYTVDPAEFYRQVNDPYAYLPEGTQILRPQQVAPVVEIKGAFPVVASVHSSAPTADDSEHMVGMGYRYRLNLFQAAGRGALGFRELIVEDLQSRITTRSRYRQDWPFLGQPLTTVVTSLLGHTLRESINNSVIFNYSTAMASQLAENGSAALSPLQVYANQLIDVEYDLLLDGNEQGEWLRETVTKITPDEYGNTIETDILKKDLYGNTYRQKTVNVYGTTTWHKERGRLTQSEVTHERYTESTGETDTVVREAQFTYYESGNLEGMLHTEVVNAQNSSGKVTTTHYYDEFGNETYSLAVGGDGVKRLSDNTVYDGRGRYASKTYSLFNRAVSASDDSGSSSGYSTQRDAAAGNAKATIQLTSSVVSRNALGLPTQTTQYTGDTTSTIAKAAYTPFGNNYFTAGSDGSYTLTTAALGSGYHCPHGAAFHTRTRVAGGAESITCYDKIGREVRRGKSSFQGDWIYVDTKYNRAGLVEQVSEPYKFTAHAYTWFGYDRLGRTILVSHPVLGYTYTHYNGLATTVVNDAGQRKTEFRDAAGDLFVAMDEDENAIFYFYTGDGQLKSMIGPSGHPSYIRYDGAGRKIGMTDPDKGTWSYKYNSLGELVCQQDAKKQTIINSYDFAGRLIGRVERAAGGNCDNPTGAIQARAAWAYDTAARGMGKLAVEWSGGVSANENSADYKKAINYDSFGRVSTVQTTLRGHNNVPGDHWEKITYDQYSRPWKTWDAARTGNTFTNNGIEQKYDAYGYPHKVLDAHTGAEYYRVDAIDDRGNVSADSLGDGVIRRGFEHDPDTGRLTNITAYDVQNRALQDLRLEWDSINNLETRHEKGLNKQGGYRDLWESFGYDDLNRLTDYTVSGDGSHTTSVRYNALGNITYKSDVGNYEYDLYGVRPHAVNKAGSHGYNYDNNGSLVSDGRGRAFTYTVADQVSRITKSGRATNFYYDANRTRYKRVDTNGSSITTTLYLGSVEKIHHADNTQEWRRYIHDSVMITQVLNTSGSVTATRKQFLLKDHLGSVNVITDGAGKITDLLAFDPWGKRRAESNWTPLPLSATQSTWFVGAKPKTSRGFTGHQMADEMEIIHMGGRIYDPLLGRFLQADPLIQSPSTTASLNRYSYVWNNPLNATDPSGFSLSSLWKEVRPFVGAIVGVVLAVTVPWAAEAWAPIVIGMISGAAGAAANGTSILKGVVFGAFSGAAYGAGGVWGSAVWGGVESYMNGGAIGRGFIAAGIGALGGAGGGGPSIKGFVTSAVLGGVATEVTGGKFKNGAASAAFMYAVSAGVGSARQVEENESVNQGMDKIENIPSDPQAVYDEAYAAARQDKALAIDESKIEFHADKVQVVRAECGRAGVCTPSDVKVMAVKEAQRFLEGNRGWYASDGAFDGSTISIYVTATSPSTLNYPKNTPQYLKYAQGLGSGYTKLSGVENVIQTLSHETGHRDGLPHGQRMQVREYDSIKFYRLNNR